MNILELENLTKTYGTGVRALNGLSLAVSRGTIFGFIGLNGAGKTTTIRILAGLRRQDEGTVHLFGREASRHDPSFKKRMGFVLDEPLYFEWMSVEEYLEFVGIMEGLSRLESRRRASELIEFLDLFHKGDDPIGTFSTGMKKKVSLAAAMIHRPELIVLDEPLEGIDALAAAMIKETLKLMAERGATVLITSHVLDTVEKLCTDIGILHKGSLLLRCPTSRIREIASERVSGAARATLEHLFVDMVGGNHRPRRPSFLSDEASPDIPPPTA